MNRVVIALPSQDTMCVDTAMSICGVLQHEMRRNAQIAIANLRGCNLPTQRNGLVGIAKQLGATHVMWTATDMLMPPNTIQRLLAHNKAFVAAGYRQRYRDGRVLIEMEDGKPMRAEEVAAARGLHSVRYTALDCSLMRMSVFDELGAHPFTFNDERTEDYVFCDALTELGYTFYVDFDLTKEVGHLGQHRYEAHVSP